MATPINYEEVDEILINLGCEPIPFCYDEDDSYRQTLLKMYDWSKEVLKAAHPHSKKQQFNHLQKRLMVIRREIAILCLKEEGEYVDTHTDGSLIYQISFEHNGKQKQLEMRSINKATVRLHVKTIYPGCTIHKIELFENDKPKDEEFRRRI